MSDDKAAVDEAWLALSQQRGFITASVNELFAAGYAAAEQHWREEQRRDDLAAVEAVLARSHNAGWQHACEEILRLVTESK